MQQNPQQIQQQMLAMASMMNPQQQALQQQQLQQMAGAPGIPQGMQQQPNGQPSQNDMMNMMQQMQAQMQMMMQQQNNPFFQQMMVQQQQMQQPQQAQVQNGEASKSKNNKQIGQQQQAAVTGFGSKVGSGGSGIGGRAKQNILNPEEEQNVREKSKKIQELQDQPVSQVKRPKSSYMIFHHENTNKVRSDNPDLIQSDIMKRCGEMWNALNEDTKEIYKKKAAEDKLRFEKEIKEEMQNNGGQKLLSHTQKKVALQKLGSNINHNQQQHSINTASSMAVSIGQSSRKKIRDPNAPKKPLTPFFIFLKKRRMELAGSEVMKQSVTNFTTQIANEWNAMSTEQKLMYKHDAELGKAVLTKAAQIANKDSLLTVTNVKPNGQQQEQNPQSIPQTIQSTPSQPIQPPQVSMVAQINGHPKPQEQQPTNQVLPVQNASTAAHQHQQQMLHAQQLAQQQQIQQIQAAQAAQQQQAAQAAQHHQQQQQAAAYAQLQQQQQYQQQQQQQPMVAVPQQQPQQMMHHPSGAYQQQQPPAFAGFQ